MPGLPFVISLIYLTLLVSFVVSLIDVGFGSALVRKTLHRWGKFLLLLVVLGIVVQVLTFIHDGLL